MTKSQRRPILSFAVLAVSFLVVLFIGGGCTTTKFPSLDNSLFETVRFQDAQDPAALGTKQEKSSQSVTIPSPGSAPAGEVIKEVRITGNRVLEKHHVLRQIRTRPGRYFDPDMLQQDVDQLWQMKEIRRVNGPYIDRQEDGIIVTFDISERPYIDRVRFVGNRSITDRQLRTETGLSNGQPLDLHAVRMAKHRIEDFYKEKGFPKTQVAIVEGDNMDDRNVVFLVYEDELQRVLNVSFEGNTIASDGRLKSLIKVKPAILWLVGGKANRREIEQDVLRLTSYYRSLGFFNAKIGRQLEESESGRWLSIRYVINEGPRYRIRNISFIGNEKYSAEQLESIVKLKSKNNEMPDFNAAKMNRDVTSIRDLYGSQGYVFAGVQAEPRFLESPGLLDLVYKIEEGKQYRVGRINVVIDGEYGVTQRFTVINRLGLRPGDLIDTRKLRSSEYRLGRSQLFADGSASSPGNPPRVVVRPPELDELEKQNFRR